MIPQSGFDIKVIVNELKELEGGRVEKFYNTKEGELLIKIYHQKFGKVILRALRGETLHLTKYQREVVEQPSPFTMLMRKYMKGAIIENIEQPFFERVVIMKIRKAEQEYNIVIELFNKGNIVVCNEKMTIINSLRFVEVKDRVIRPNETYELPEPRFKDVYLDKIEFKRTIKGSDKESIVKTLALDIGLGGKYAEELTALAEMEKEKKPGVLKDKEVENLFKIFFIMYKSVKHYKNIKPCLIIKDGETVNFAPFPFKSYEGFEFKFYETFNEACDDYYSTAQKEEHENKAQQVYENKIEQLEKRLETQKENLERLEEESKKYAKLGETVFANHDLINTILTKLLNANKNNVSWNDIKKMIKKEQEGGSVEANSIKNINEEEGTITLNIDNNEFTVELNTNPTQIAQEFFEKSKKMKNKINGAVESVETTQEKIERTEEKGIEVAEKITEKKETEKKWYEKYRWMRTTNNYLLVCGKDATQNEILVKKVAEDNDLIFHATITGSPFGILKNGKRAERTDKEDAAQFIASYSRAWRENLSTDVFSVEKNQVSKTAPSGEYVAHGSFIIKGEKEYYKGLWPEISVGYSEKDGVIAGPENLIKERSEVSVTLRPGSINPGKVSRRLMDIFDKKELKSEDFLQFVPGDASIEL